MTLIICKLLVFCKICEYNLNSVTMKNLNKLNIKVALLTIIVVLSLISCEGHSDPADDNGIDKKELDNTRSRIDSLPSSIKKDYIRSDSALHYKVKKDIEVLRAEILVLKEEIKKLKSKK